MNSSIEGFEIYPYLSLFSIVCNDRNIHGGGVALLLSLRVRFVVSPDLCDGYIEFLWAEPFPSIKISVLLTDHHLNTTFLIFFGRK